MKRINPWFALALLPLLAACAGRPATVSGSLVRYTAGVGEPAPFRDQLIESPVLSVAELEQVMKGQDAEFNAARPVLGPGDRLRVMVSNGEVFSGVFEVDDNGRIGIPYLLPVPVAGLEPEQVSPRLTAALVAEGHFRPTAVQVTVKPKYWAPVELLVSGAVFDPGAVKLTARSAEERQTYDQVSSGDAGADRNVIHALRVAGGVRPDADLSRVILMRSGRIRVLDLTGVVLGHPHERALVAAGDRIHVPSKGRLDPRLATLSRITPPGIRVFLSNLTVPADSNTESAVNEHATKLPYGARLSHGLFSANCIGGTPSVNAGRVAVLVGTDVLSGELRFMEVPVEEVIRNPASSMLNPMLLPNDAVGCYDSRVWNWRDLARTASDILNPMRVLSDVVRGPRY